MSGAVLAAAADSATLVLAARLPVADWQFWVTTAIALLAAGWLLRGLFGKRRRGRSKRVTLTLGGKAVSSKD